MPFFAVFLPFKPNLCLCVQQFCLLQQEVKTALLVHLKLHENKKTNTELLLKLYSSSSLSHFKATQMGCVQVSYLRLTSSKFCGIFARMNYFEAHMMALSQKVDSKV